jgi:replicative DNA helicase
MDYVIQLAETVPTSANAVHYAHIVRDKAVQRRLINEATDIIREARAQPEDVRALLDRAEQKIFDIGGFDRETTTESIEDLVKSVMKRIDGLQSQDQGRITGLSTGFMELNEILDGLHPSELIIIAARPSMGKTSLALNISDNIAAGGENGVLVFSCEMARGQVASNMLCANARIDGHKMRRGQLSDEDWQELTFAADRLSRVPIYIDDTPGLSINTLRAKARRMFSRHEEIKLIVVDYLQLLSYDARAENRQIEITKISQGLKHLARELRVPIICLSQLNRSVESRVDKRPVMADLRESGSIEQDADVIIFIYREEQYNPTPDNRHAAELIIAKQRNGPTGKLDFQFFDKFMRFHSRTHVEPRETITPEDVRL